MNLTLGFITRDNKILLGHKKRGFGKGKWAGFGGKLNSNESIANGLKREFKEEVGLDIKQMAKVGIVEFIFLVSNEHLFVHIYNIADYKGEVTESDEMKPKWFKISDIPYDEMWPDNKLWLPYFLSGQKFVGNFTYDRTNQIENYTLNKVDNLE